MSDLVEPLVVRFRPFLKMVDCGATKGRQLIANGDVDARRLGKSLVVTVASIRAYVERLPPAKGVAPPAEAMRARAERRTARDMDAKATSNS